MLPNFLIVGAAKCGTTSLFKYLEKHPQVFLSNPKEPKFLTSDIFSKPLSGPGDDIVENNIIKDIGSYNDLFSKVTNEKVIGEASADLLYYHKHSIPRIKEVCGSDAKIIIILRNPVDRAFSAYTHLRRDFRETLTFEEALSDEENRINSNYEFLWHYKKVGLFYEQVKDFINNFDHVKVIILDELKRQPENVLNDLYEFLEINEEFEKIEYKIHNPSGIPKSNLYFNLVNSKGLLKLIIKLLIPQKMRSLLINKLKFINLRKVKIDEKNKATLLEYYRDDILKLSKLLNKDLSHWLK